MSFSFRLSMVLALLLLGPALASGQDWPGWRGPNRDGVVTGFSVPSTWPKELKRQWQVEVGEGYSTPVVSAGKVYVLARQKEDEVVRCLNLETGKEIWRQSYPAPYEVNLVAAAHGPGPKSTPAVRDGRLFTFGISGILSCFDARTGDVKWRHDFTNEYKITAPLYGTAMSPLVEDGLCVAHVGGHDHGALTAFDVDTGKVKWAWKGDGPSYASPILATLSGSRQLITQTQKFVLCVAWPSGEVLWEFPCHTSYDQNIVTPLIFQDTIIIGGYGEATAAFRLVKEGDALTVKDVWRDKSVPMYMSSPVLAGNLLFGMTHRGNRLFCLDVSTGKLQWQGKDKVGDNAALLRAGTDLIVLTSTGTLIVARAVGDSFQPLAEYKVSDTPTWAHPVPVGKQILIKDRKTLTAWEVAP